MVTKANSSHRESDCRTKVSLFCAYKTDKYLRRNRCSLHIYNCPVIIHTAKTSLSRSEYLFNRILYYVKTSVEGFLYSKNFTGLTAHRVRFPVRAWSMFRPMPNCLVSLSLSLAQACRTQDLKRLIYHHYIQKFYYTYYKIFIQQQTEHYNPNSQPQLFYWLVSTVVPLESLLHKDTEARKLN